MHPNIESPSLARPDRRAVSLHRLTACLGRLCLLLALAGCDLPAREQWPGLEVVQSSRFAGLSTHHDRRFASRFGVRVHRRIVPPEQLPAVLSRGTASVVLLSDPERMARLERAGLIAHPRWQFIERPKQLAVFARRSGLRSIASLRELARIADLTIAMPDSPHPHGTLIRDELNRLGLYGQLQPRTTLTATPADAVRLLRTGAVDAALVVQGRMVGPVDDLRPILRVASRLRTTRPICGAVVKTPPEPVWARRLWSYYGAACDVP